MWWIYVGIGRGFEVIGGFVLGSSGEEVYLSSQGCHVHLIYAKDGMAIYMMNSS